MDLFMNQIPVFKEFKKTFPGSYFEITFDSK